MRGSRPFFSIIIPTYMRPEHLTTCLRALAELRYPHDRFEVIIVDDGSSLPLDGVVMPWRACFNLTLLTQAHTGPATARNTGAARAQGTFLVFTDDDCTPASDWLHTLAARVTTTPDCAIGGAVHNKLPQNLYATASQLLVDYLYTYYNADPHRARFFTSNNLTVPTAQFRAIGGFDTTFPLAAAEDRDFCDRWLVHGYRMIYASEVVVHHAHTMTWRTFLKQHFNYGRGASYFHRLRARRGQGPIRLEPFVFYRCLLQYPFRRLYGLLALKVTALFVASQSANAAGFWWEHRKHPRGGKTPR